MELQYPDYLPGIGAQDLQEDGYSREFLDYNRIDSDPIASSYTHNPNHILKSDHQSAGIESPGYNCNPASEVKIPAIPSNPGISACKPPGLRQSSPVTSTTDTEQENDPKDIWPSTTRVRTVFSEKQKRILMQRFQRQKYISPQERSELANALGLNCKQVKTWYQNRRMKLKRRQYIRPPATSWNQSNFNPISSQTLTLTHELTPGLMKSHFISYEQQSMLSSGQAVPFRKHRTSFACPIVEVFQSSPIHGGPQCSSASSYFQSLPPTDCPDPGFGGFHKEHLAIPHARSLSFRNQIPRSGMGYPAVEILRSSSVEKDMQCIATSASFPPSEGDHISPSFNIQTVGREAIASSQDIQIHPNNWCPMQGDGSSPGYISLAPVFDAYGVQQSGSADLFNEGYPMTLSGTF